MKGTPETDERRSRHRTSCPAIAALPRRGWVGPSGAAQTAAAQHEGEGGDPEEDCGSVGSGIRHRRKLARRDRRRMPQTVCRAAPQSGLAAAMRIRTRPKVHTMVAPVGKSSFTER